MTRAPGRTAVAFLSAAALAVAWLPADGDARERGRSAADRCDPGEIAAVADRVAGAFETHPFVFLGSTHGGVKRHEFLLCLLSRPATRAIVTDIVVEFVSGAHQELLDRYLVGLEEVPAESLRLLALDTDRPELFATLPQVPEFLRAVREINRSLGPADRIRVLGGSETIRWSEVDGPEDLAPFPFKTNWTAHLIVEHLAPDPGRRALVVYGDGHIKHGNGTLMSDIEAALDPARLFVVGTLVDLDPAERSLIAAFGDPDRPFFLPADELPTVDRIPDDLVPIVADSRAPDPRDLPRKVDALVYLGPGPDGNLEGTLELSDAEREELARRRSVKTRETLEIRFGGRDLWFEGHPLDLPPDPRAPQGASASSAAGCSRDPNSRFSSNG